MFLSILPLAILTSCLVSNVDFIYYLLFKYGVFKHQLSITGHSFRILILSVVSLEGCRSVTHVFFLVFVFLSRIEKITKCLAFFKDNSDRFRFYTNLVSIEFRKIQWLLDILIYVAITPNFWLVVILIWVLVRYSPSEMSYPLYIAMCGVTICLLVMLMCVIPLASKQMDAYKMGIGLNILCARELNTSRKTKQSHFFTKTVILHSSDRIELWLLWKTWSRIF